QVSRADFVAGTTSGHVEAGASFVGNVGGLVNGTMTLDHNSLLVDGGQFFQGGWLVGTMKFTDASGGYIMGPVVLDHSVGGSNGFFFQTQGSGAYNSGILSGPIQG